MVIIEFDCKNRPGVALRIFQALSDLNLEEIDLIAVERKIPLWEKIFSFVLRTKPCSLSGHGKIVVQDHEREPANNALLRLSRNEKDLGIRITARYFQALISLPNTPGALRDSLAKVRSKGVSIHEITTGRIPQGAGIPPDHRVVTITLNCPIGGEAYRDVKDRIRPYLVNDAE